MNFKTTLALLVLVLAGGIGWIVYRSLQGEAPTSETLDVLEHQLTPAEITRVEISRGERRVVLQRSGPEWSLPGKWPVRLPEVKELLATLGGLRSRFAPLPVGGAEDLKRFGLDEASNPLRLVVKAGGHDFALTFGEGAEDRNRFSRPTYVRLADKGEVVRLGPGLVALLDRPQEHYMQRRLFPGERVAKDKEGASLEKVEQLAATSLAVRGDKTAYTLARAGSDWELRAPVQDRPDPEVVKKILTGVPDIWVERFVDAKGKGLDEFGLAKPEATVRVGRPGGEITLVIGKQSDMKTRIVKKDSPPGAPFMPQKPQIDIVHEEYKYAKLKDNEQLFEIKADHLKELLVPVDTLRDPQVVRFRTEDVKRIEIHDGGRDLAFAKEKESWRLQKPLAVEAEGSKVSELLDKLAGLQARGPDVLDKADPRTTGLDKAAKVQLALEEGKPTRARQITFLVGKDDPAKKKLYVQVAGRGRVNLVEDAVEKLLKRPALAYRGRRVIDLSEGDLARLDVQRGGDHFTLQQAKGAWKLTAPVEAEVDRSKAEQLARELARLEAVEFITDQPAKADLDKLYGLNKPALTIRATLTDAKKPAPTLLVGKQRAGKQEHYAQLAGDPAVFVVGKEAFEALDREALAYRPLELWHVPAEELADLTVSGKHAYALRHEGDNWKITSPFQAVAAADEIRPLTEELAAPKAERYVALAPKDLGQYGLDKAYLRLAIRSAAKKDGGKEPAKEYVLLLGKETAKDTKTRFARLASGEAVFVVGDKLVSAVDRRPLDLLDRKLLTLDVGSIQAVRATGGHCWALGRDKSGWRLSDSPAPPFPADKEAVEETLRAWADLRAERFAAYGGKVELAAYGLEKPQEIVTLTAKPGGDKQKGKAAEHVLALGKPLEASKGARYARLDSGPAVVVLDANTAARINRSFLDFVPHSLLDLDPAKISALQRTTPGGELAVVRQGSGWQLVKPEDKPADRPTLERLTRRLARLRAQRVVAYPAKELARFGLDKPAAVITLRLGTTKEKAAQHVVSLGAPASKESKNSERFARVDQSDAVVVLPADLTEQLLAEPLEYRDRDLVKVEPPTRASLERGPRKATFTLVEDSWKMTAPVEGEAEATLGEFAQHVSRLRADRLVAEKPADLKPFGLDRPQARWRFAAGGKDELTLTVGAFEKATGKRAYATLGKGELVFLLDEALTRETLAEYRSRKVWPALDAFQVEKLHYRYAKETFDLVKVDNQWQLAGKPEAKVNADAVRETLDALARLEAEHYALDKGADWALFGLSPPTLTLEVETSSGKRILLVGGQEGGSARRYATVSATADAPIFVIADGAARKVVRPLAAFFTTAKLR